MRHHRLLSQPHQRQGPRPAAPPRPSAAARCPPWALPRRWGCWWVWRRWWAAASAGALGEAGPLKGRGRRAEEGGGRRRKAEEGAAVSHHGPHTQQRPRHRTLPSPKPNPKTLKPSDLATQPAARAGTATQAPHTLPVPFTPTREVDLARQAVARQQRVARHGGEEVGALGRRGGAGMGGAALHEWAVQR